MGFGEWRCPDPCLDDAAGIIILTRVCSATGHSAAPAAGPLWRRAAPRYTSPA